MLPTMTDEARPTATRHPLSLDEVSRRFEDAGLPRNSRTLQRCCVADGFARTLFHMVT
jgi:hypothetical protein